MCSTASLVLSSQYCPCLTPLQPPTQTVVIETARPGGGSALNGGGEQRKGGEMEARLWSCGPAAAWSETGYLSSPSCFAARCATGGSSVLSPVLKASCRGRLQLPTPSRDLFGYIYIFTIFFSQYH